MSPMECKKLPSLLSNTALRPAECEASKHFCVKRSRSGHCRRRGMWNLMHPKTFALKGVGLDIAAAEECGMQGMKWCMVGGRGDQRSAIAQFRRRTLLWKGTQVWFEIPAEIPAEYDYMMPRLPENAKIKIPQVGSYFTLWNGWEIPPFCWILPPREQYFWNFLVRLPTCGILIFAFSGSLGII